MYVLIHEGRNEAPRYFIRLGLGIFWECSTRIEDARTFARRKDAVSTMQRAGKHREGWRVLSAADLKPHTTSDFL